MKKILFISGSARNGNCKLILENIQKNFWLEYSTDVVFIRDYNLKECVGCNSCLEKANNECVAEDRMSILLEKIMDADIVVLATPNYFYNISGLTKTFLDKTYPCYHTGALKGKKFIYIYIGNDKAPTIKKYLDNAMYGFTVCQEVSVLGSFAYSADGIGQINDPAQAKNTTDEIINLIRKNLSEE